MLNLVGDMSGTPAAKSECGSEGLQRRGAPQKLFSLKLCPAAVSRGGETEHCRLRGRSQEHLPYHLAVSEFLAGLTPRAPAEPPPSLTLGSGLDENSQSPVHGGPHWD